MNKILVGGLFALLLATTAAAQSATLDAIQRDPVRFDRRSVVLRGTVGFVESGARPTFVLIDGAQTIRVVAPPGPPVKPGDRVEVEGLYSFAGNQIEAHRLTWR